MEHSSKPLFQAWPPELVGDKDMRRFSSIGRLFGVTDVVLLVVLLVGFTLILLAALFHLGAVGKAFLEGIGIAAITATILGETIDKLLKKGLIQDAVQSSLGYMVPNELKEEMRWIYDQRFIAMEHIQRCTLVINDDQQTVTLHCESTRRLVNFTDQAQSIKIGLAVDEWGFDRKPTRILRVTYRLGNGSWKEIPADHVSYREGALSTEPRPEEWVPKGEFIEVELAFEETKRLNDIADMVFTYPTRHPRVIVKADPKLEAVAKFGHRNQGEMIPNPASGSYQLAGTLLPEQHIVLRWWPKANESEANNEQGKGRV